MYDAAQAEEGGDGDGEKPAKRQRKPRVSSKNRPNAGTKPPHTDSVAPPKPVVQRKKERPAQEIRPDDVLAASGPTLQPQLSKRERRRQKKSLAKQSKERNLGDMIKQCTLCTALVQVALAACIVESL
jgi:hypothetical protein